MVLALQRQIRYLSRASFHGIGHVYRLQYPSNYQFGTRSNFHYFFHQVVTPLYGQQKNMAKSGAKKKYHCCRNLSQARGKRERKKVQKHFF